MSKLENESRGFTIGHVIVFGILMFTLYACYQESKTPLEQQMDCYVKGMKNQSEHMKAAVWKQCKIKTGYIDSGRSRY